MHADLTARAWDERACATLLLGGARVAAAHRQLVQRATALGHVLTDDPAPMLIADGVELALERPEPGVLRAVLPPGTRGLRLVSHNTVPAELEAASDDRRRLGVAVLELRYGGRAVPLDAAAFAAGFYAPERGWRWSDGDALLRLAPRRRPAVLELRFGVGWCRYWSAAPAASARLT